MPPPRDLTGQRFGRLVAVRHDGQRGKDRLWLCRCDCGQTTHVSVGSLSSGNTSSCGCFRLERVRTHALSSSPEYAIWKAARNRCHNPNAQGFADYGARGIRMCEEWRRSFAAFYRDMGPRPSNKHSIDRRDNDGPYAADNCRWATSEEQKNNTRANARLTWNRQTLTMAQWARRVGISVSALKCRLELNWSLEEALSKPPDRFENRHDSKKLTLGSVTKTIPAWARHLGIHPSSLRERLERMPIERALTMQSHQHSNGYIAQRNASE